jgi:cell division GTPase FtsZ
MSRYTEKELKEFRRNGGKYLTADKMMDTICILAGEILALEQENQQLRQALGNALDLIEGYRIEVIDFELHKAVLGFDGMKQIKQAEQLLDNAKNESNSQNT